MVVIIVHFWVLTTITRRIIGDRAAAFRHGRDGMIKMSEENVSAYGSPRKLTCRLME